MKLKHAVSILSLVSALCLLFAGCGDDDDSTATDSPAAAEEAAGDEGHTYVGKVEGTDAYVAIVTNSAGDHAGGYVCDGKNISVWIGRSPLTDGRGALLTRSESTSVGEVEISGERASGEIEIDEQPHAFNAEPAAGEAGLYHRVAGERGADYSETGWVVLADGSYRGTRRTATSTTAAGRPSGTSVGWINPDTQPWINPDTQP